MADKNSGFLGGGPQFNKVGASVTEDGTPEAIPTGPQPVQSYQVRNAIIVVAILVMLGILFFISDPGGVIHKSGRGGTPVNTEQPAPPKNF
jgi:hypothetical protein